MCIYFWDNVLRVSTCFLIFVSRVNNIKPNIFIHHLPSGGTTIKKMNLLRTLKTITTHKKLNNIQQKCLLWVMLLLGHSALAQQLLYQNFDSFSNGSLSGQGTWVTENSNTIKINIDNAASITGCFGGGGRYITPQTAATLTTERLSFPTTNWVTNASQCFYLSFLIDISSAGTEVNAHIISLGNDFGGTKYEFSRIHARPSGLGFNIGISKGGGTNLGANSVGINWSTDVYSFNITYFVVLRYDYAHGGGANADVIRAWVNPAITNGSEPTTGSAVAVIPAGSATYGNDILFDGDNVRNVYINNRANGPIYKIDEIRYARGTTSANAWSNLGISGSCPTTLPVSLVSFTAKAEGNYAKLQWQTTQEVNSFQFTVYRKSEGGEFVKIGDVPASVHRDGQFSTYAYIDRQPLNGNNYYRLVQIDNDGKATELGVKSLAFSLSAFPLHLSPNPAKNQLNISVAQMGKTFKVYNAQGKKVLQQPLNQMQNSIDITSLPIGVYFYNYGKEKGKFVKE